MPGFCAIARLETHNPKTATLNTSPFSSELARRALRGKNPIRNVARGESREAWPNYQLELHTPRAEERHDLD